MEKFKTLFVFFLICVFFQPQFFLLLRALCAFSVRLCEPSMIPLAPISPYETRHTNYAIQNIPQRVTFPPLNR